MEETFQSSGKLDKKRILKAAEKVGIQPPSNCGLSGKGSNTQLAAFAELVAHEIFAQAKFAASTPGGGSASSSQPLNCKENAELDVEILRRNVEILGGGPAFFLASVRRGGAASTEIASWGAAGCPAIGAGRAN
jgi:hypothetical protein